MDFTTLNDLCHIAGQFNSWRSRHLDRLDVPELSEAVERVVQAHDELIEQLKRAR